MKFDKFFVKFWLIFPKIWPILHEIWPLILEIRQFFAWNLSVLYWNLTILNWNLTIFAWNLTKAKRQEKCNATMKQPKMRQEEMTRRRQKTTAPQWPRFFFETLDNQTQNDPRLGLRFRIAALHFSLPFQAKNFLQFANWRHWNRHCGGLRTVKNTAQYTITNSSHGHAND